MERTLIVCGVKKCRNYSDSGCMKKTIMLTAEGKCLSVELDMAAEAAAKAAAERVLEYGA